ncbi:MAG TPA: hypothetical protein VEX13_11420 [Chloroflexia bacterium]|nr:hypothetical protein [Chloroflexia bacterium]
MLYIVALVAMPPEGLTHHDTGAKYLQVRNLRLTPTGLDWSINYPARSLDPGLEFVPFHPRQHEIDDKGHIHLQWPIFLGLLTRIPWKVMGFWGLYLVPLLAGLGTLWASYRLALAVGVPRKAAWLAVPLVGLATPISIYSLLFFEHTLASMLVTLSLLAAVTGIKSDTHAMRTIALSGALLAVAIYFRSELYILALVMGLVYLWAAWRHGARQLLVIWCAAFVLALVPLWGFYFITEGSLLPLHATYYFAGSSDPGSTSNGPGGIALPALRYIATAGWGVIPDFLYGPQTFPLSPMFSLWEELAGLVGVGLCALAALSKVARAQLAWRMPALLVGLVLIALASLPTLLSMQGYYNLHGFVLASPFVALALWPTAHKNARLGFAPQTWLYIVALLYVGLHALIISSFSGLGPISRHEWGQRYLLPAYPALVVLSLLAAYHIWSTHNKEQQVSNNPSRFTFYVLRFMHHAPRAIILLWAILALTGFGFSVRGYAMLSDERTQVVAWQHLARTLPEREPLVTDVWWLPLNLAADFYTRPIMLAEGDDRLERWAEQMRERGVTHFGLMTTRPSTFTAPWTTRLSGLTAEGQPEQARGIWLQRYSLSP